MAWIRITEPYTIAAHSTVGNSRPRMQSVIVSLRLGSLQNFETSDARVTDRLSVARLTTLNTTLLSPSSLSFPAPFLLLTRGILSLKLKSQRVHLSNAVRAHHRTPHHGEGGPQKEKTKLPVTTAPGHVSNCWVFLRRNNVPKVHATRHRPSGSSRPR